LSKSIFRRKSLLNLPFGIDFRRVLFSLVALLALSAFIAGGLSFHSSAQANDPREASFEKKADKLLKRVRSAVVEDRKAALKGGVESGVGNGLGDERSALKRLSRIVHLRRHADNSVGINVAVTLTADGEAELKNAGFQLQSRIGDVATLELDVDQLSDLAALRSVEKIFAPVVRYPLNDRARASAGVDNILGQRVVPQTGQGVVVGIIDTGIDFRHLDFTVPGSGGHQTRIKALLDMTEYGAQSPDPGWNYSLPGQSGVIGRLYTEADINSALQIPKPADQNADLVKQRDKNGHGTHVAGTAAGNGLSAPNPGTYAGMAPAADLIIVKASRQNDGAADFNSTDVINALEFVKQRAAELGKPFVINLSLGGQLGPHDGTNPDERAIDNLVNGGPGRSVCIAAGNEGDSSIHARGTVPAGGSQTLDFNVNGAAYIVDLYQNNADRFRVTVTSPDGIALGPVSYDANGFSFPDGQAANQYLEIFNANDDKGDADVGNDQPDIVVLFKPGAPNGMWKIKLDDVDGNANQSYDAWSAGEGVYFSTFVDHDSHLIASPGTARGAITVGAFVTRSATFTFGSAAPFTSPGPTADGRQKPEISAPGYYLYSSRSTDITDPNFGTIGAGADAPTDSTHYTGLAGTSMATPVTAGAVALFLESNPVLTSEQIKDSIDNTASQDSFTDASGWGRLLGFGKLNIAAAIQLNGRRVYTISGNVTGTINGNATLTLSGSQSGVVNVDASGNYRFKNLIAGGTYTVTPSVTQGTYQYRFSPPSYTFTDLNANQTANFTASLGTHNISGRITDTAGNGVAGVQVRPNFGSSQTTSSDANGYYTLANLPAGQSYDVVVSHSDYTFDSPHQYLGVITEDATANFVATRLYKITGRVIDRNGVGIGGVAVTVTGGDSRSGSTNSDGSYALNSLRAGLNYTLSIWHSDYAFNPEVMTFSNLAADQIANFSAVQAFTIEGRLLDAHGAVLSGLQVTLSGSSSATTLSNPPGGYYAFQKVGQGGNYTVTPSVPGFVSSPASRTFNNLSSTTYTADFVLSPETSIDATKVFVRQHYLDFLNREPDASGLNFWTENIDSCNANLSCLELKRVTTSAAFFLSIEFQETGYLVERLYKVAYGDAVGTSNFGPVHQLPVPVVRFNEFLPDTQQISQGVVVGQLGWEQKLAANKIAFAQDFASRSRFTTAYPGTMTPEQFVDNLYLNAGVTPAAAERASVIGLFGGAPTSADATARARALGRIAENSTLNQRETNKAFVLMQYFGYLRRNPNEGRDSDYSGYDFWLTKLNQFNGNFVNAEMVKAFIVASEYRQRFGR